MRWIGSLAGDTPASITTVTRPAPPENAGGEAGDKGPAAVPAAGASAAASDGSTEAGPDWEARGVGLAALLAALSAVVTRCRARPG